MKKIFLLCLILSVSIVFFAQKPNIVFILADDMGYGDIAALNEKCQIKTPNIDKLAHSGLVFTDAHASAAVCTPTRYGILTGRYNWRSTLKQGVSLEYGSPIIDAQRTTIASMLKKQGYQTACIGKWHLGFNWATTDGQQPVDNGQTCNIDFTKPILGGPTDVGFDHFFGIDAPNFPPFCFIEDKILRGLPTQFYPVRYDLDCRAGKGIPDWRLEKVLPTLQEKTVTYIEKATQSKAPFFLYLPITAPHTPIVPDENFMGKSGINKYADFVMQVDGYVGEIVKTLEKNKALQNTIIVFTSDNGCSPVANFKELKEHGHNPNYVFRGMKSDAFEGGHRIPCIVQWKGHIKESRKVDKTICLNDFMATFAQITQYSFADNEAEDSYSLLPFFKNKPKKYQREATVHHSLDGSFTIRKGKWKLILCAGSGGWSSPQPGKAEEGLPIVQLYDIENDIAESQNLQAAYPSVVKEMTTILAQYVNNGRSTKGLTQQNNGDFLKNKMAWMPN